MRHRIGNINTGLGNPTNCLLPNTWSDNEKFNNIVKKLFDDVLKIKEIEEFGGCDFKVEKYKNGFNIDFGYEPAYQYEEMFIYHIEKEINKCNIKHGKAQDSYGSNIKIYKEEFYPNCNLEFKELLDKWHKKLNMRYTNEDKKSI